MFSEEVTWVTGSSTGIGRAAAVARFTPPDMRERMTAAIPMGREGTPEEVAWAVVFLASSWAD